jgi:ABC-2 type transport system ATP-binding protein
MTLAINTQGLQKQYGKKTVLSGLNLQVPRGAIYGFLGNNGAGKTTTIALLTGILLPSSGEIQILGETMAPENEALRQRLGIVYDKENLFENLTAREHILFSAGLHAVDNKQAVQRCDELLDLFRLREEADVRIRDYSHGMKKKTALACSMVHDPDLLFLDEPFEGMDVGSTNATIETLRSLGNKGRTVFVTSHILPLVERFCDDIGILHDGRSVYQSSPVKEQSSESLEQLFLRLTGNTSNNTLSWAR